MTDPAPVTVTASSRLLNAGFTTRHQGAPVTSISEPGQHHVVITSDGLHGSIHLDGQDVGNQVRGYTIHHEGGQPAQVVLRARLGTSVVFDGQALVAVADECPDTDPVVAFLSGIDPDELANAAVQRTDLDGGRNELTRAALRQLRDWAKGQR
ncbi:hypothetical protein [Kitasatospora sp. NPDC058478]|uniref:hypothetical protein n=1 Tax=unclassified Kitasatospora TaxID=2633591 RepID=UPI0036550628